MREENWGFIGWGEGISGAFEDERPDLISTELI